jgi:hypothetical protein
MSKIDRQKIELENYVRELEKSLGVFKNVEKYLKASAMANAALHLSQEVLPPPLYGQVTMAMKGIRLVLRSYKRKVPKLSVELSNV